MAPIHIRRHFTGINSPNWYCDFHDTTSLSEHQETQISSNRQQLTFTETFLWALIENPIIFCHKCNCIPIACKCIQYLDFYFHGHNLSFYSFFLPFISCSVEVGLRGGYPISNIHYALLPLQRRVHILSHAGVYCGWLNVLPLQYCFLFALLHSTFVYYGINMLRKKSR